MLKWLLEKFIPLAGIVVAVASSADLILSKWQPVPVALGVAAAACLIAIYLFACARRYVLSVVLLCFGVAIAVAALKVYRSEASLDITIDNIDPFEELNGLSSTIYGTAGEIDGTVVYGRGQRLLVSLRNVGSGTLEPSFGKVLPHSASRMKDCPLPFEKISYLRQSPFGAGPSE